MLNATTATREEARHEAGRMAWDLIQSKHPEPDGRIVAEPTEVELETLRFIINGQTSVIDLS